MSLWVDKYRPTSLAKLDYHKEQANKLKNLVSLFVAVWVSGCLCAFKLEGFHIGMPCVDYQKLHNVVVFCTCVCIKTFLCTFATGVYGFTCLGIACLAAFYA